MAQTVFSITEFGAVGDGVTVSTAAIQRALDAAGDCRGTVTVPPGTYKTGRLVMHAGTVLRGDRASAYAQDGASVLSLCDAGAPCLLDITGAFGGTVKGLCLNGNMLGNDIHGIFLSWDVYNGGGHEDTVTMDDCRVSNFSGDGVHLNHAWCFTVRQCHLAFCRGAGLFFDGWDAFLYDNWFSGNSHYGLRGGAVTSSVTATGNRVEWNRHGGFLFRNGDSFNLGDNFFDRNYGPALTLGDGGTNDLWGQVGARNRVLDASVCGNIFRRNGKPLDTPFEDIYDSSHLRLSHSGNLVVTGNVFKYGCDDDGGGALSPEYALVCDSCHHTIVRGNAMHEGCMTRSVICLYPGEDVSVTDNVGRPVHAVNGVHGA